ncbi:MAG: hypothetical protein K2K85_04875 [Clostridia bacterium]|nr:hypothetical protein [Clostridia bacterium]
MEKSHQYKKVIAKLTVGLRPTDQAKMSQGSILSVLLSGLDFSTTLKMTDKVVEVTK